MHERIAGRYRIDGQIDGDSFEAFDAELARPVIVRVPATRDRDALDRLQREAWAAARAAHPNVVRVFDVDVDRDPPHVVFERVDGVALDVVRAEGPLGLDELVTLVGASGEGLAALHRAGVLHRGISGAALLVPGARDLAHAKWTKLGLARVPGADRVTHTNALLGEPAYLAPELLVGEEATTSTDVFAWGVLLYECVTGRELFDHHDATVALAAIADPVPVGDVRALRDDVPAELADWLAVVVAKDRSRRFRTMREALAAFESVSRTIAVGATPSRQRVMARSWVALGLVLTAALVVASVVASGLAWVDWKDARSASIPRVRVGPTDFVRLDVTAAPIFGDITTGQAQGRSGGELDARAVGVSCGSFMSRAAGHRITRSSPVGLTLTVTSTSSDLAIVVREPDGTFRCDDDSAAHMMPALSLAPAVGETLVWVTDFGTATRADYRLTVR